MTKRIKRRIKEDHSIGEDTINDHNNIERLLCTSYLLKTFKIIIIISNITYFLGVLWIMLCQTSKYFVKQKIDTDSTNYFYLEHGFDALYESEPENPSQVNARIMLISVYFSFTSLSTVGLGDYHPKSNIERVVTAMLLLVGVAVFSYILGNFIEILQQIQ